MSRVISFLQKDAPVGQSNHPSEGFIAPQELCQVLLIKIPPHPLNNLVRWVL